MQVIDGKACAQQIKNKIRAEVQTLVQSGRRAPRLAILFVGTRADSLHYVRIKRETCVALGISCQIYEFADTASQADILYLVEQLNRDAQTDAILIQLPLPGQYDTRFLLNAVDYRKDADGLHPMNVGLLHLCKPYVLPCTPDGILTLLDAYRIPIAGRRAVVVGRSALVGEPTAQLLCQRNATVTLCHSHTRHLSDIVKSADILVLAAGCPDVVRPDELKNGVTVIDVAMNRVQGRLVGDIYNPDNLSALERRVTAITPVPGGVGPMTVAMLMRNVLQLYRKAHPTG